MTLRQYLERERYQILEIVMMIGGWAGMFASVYLLKHFGSLAQLVGLLAFLCLPLTRPRLLRLIRCPNCAARLGELAELHAISYLATKRARDPTATWKLEPIGGCANCGLRLDEEIASAKS